MNDADIPSALEAFQTQAKACRAGGSSFSATVLEYLAMDFAKQGPAYVLARQWDDDAVKNAMALRLLGGLHRLVLDGSASDLALHYPSVGGTPTTSLAADVIQSVADHSEFLARYMEQPPQTNEVGRSHALLGGFLELSKTTGLPLDLLEIGSSAGLNLFWDLFAYDNETFNWGHSDSHVHLKTDWTGPVPPIHAVPDVASRAGCDIAPVDVTDADDCRRLESYVWADQPDRLERLRGAINIARETPYELDQADAGLWLKQKLSQPKDGRCTVIFHSIMWQYMPHETQERAQAAILDAGAKATESAPIAWLRLEPAAPTLFPVVTLTTWSGAAKVTEHVLATSHFHGAWIRWGESEPGRWA